ncbi:lipase member M-like [Excalfactoria chinensis]|uniref:lipase member M-like n=1 Tax=Excalfactoria chinensis TaxID=46218 RepID=UPI003B3A7D30
MWCFLMLLCSQATAFSAGFTSPHTLKSEEGLHRKQYNPENLMNVTEMIRYHGYPSEEYEVNTEDGYILGVFRIPSGRNMQNTGQKPAVLLHHGTFADCTYWIANLPNNSLGFILADAGYDVWLGNSRGNTWSSKHKTLKTCQKKFWQFRYSVEKDYLKKATFRGLAALGFVAFSTYPELAERVQMFFALGPVLTITHATSPFTTLVRLPQPVIKSILGCKGALRQNQLLRRLAIQLCTTLPKFCANILYYIAGGRTQNLNESRTDVYVGHYPAGTSVQNIIHWHQLSYVDRYQAFDYGPRVNMQKYNQTTPPAYEIEKISTPIAVWSGGQDKFADPKDVSKLLSQISNLYYHENFPFWGHLDFVWGLDAAEKMFWKIAELIRK